MTSLYHITDSEFVEMSNCEKIWSVWGWVPKANPDDSSDSPVEITSVDSRVVLNPTIIKKTGTIGLDLSSLYQTFTGSCTFVIGPYTKVTTYTIQKIGRQVSVAIGPAFNNNFPWDTYSNVALFFDVDFSARGLNPVTDSVSFTSYMNIKRSSQVASGFVSGNFSPGYGLQAKISFSIGMLTLWQSVKFLDEFEFLDWDPPNTNSGSIGFDNMHFQYLALA